VRVPSPAGRGSTGRRQVPVVTTVDRSGQDKDKTMDKKMTDTDTMMDKKMMDKDKTMDKRDDKMMDKKQ
jgi:hypothetical protein